MESSKTLVLSPDVKCLPSVINEVPDHLLKGELVQWREAFTIADARAQDSGVFTVAELAVA